jgi:uncharacterized protein YhaN
VPPKDLDLLYIALRLTLIEKVSSKMRVPVLIDDALVPGLEEPKAVLLGRMLKHLGTLTQVLQISAEPPAGVSDGIVKV